MKEQNTGEVDGLREENKRLKDEAAGAGMTTEKDREDALIIARILMTNAFGDVAYRLVLAGKKAEDIGGKNAECIIGELIPEIARIRAEAARKELDKIKAEELSEFRMDELDAVMLSVDKWLDGPALKNNPATRAADAREIALRAIEEASRQARREAAELSKDWIEKNLTDDNRFVGSSGELYQLILAAPTESEPVECQECDSNGPGSTKSDCGECPLASRRWATESETIERDSMREFAYSVLEEAQSELGIEISEESWARIEDNARDRLAKRKE